MGKLNGKVALITGAGSGIGRASALLFAKEGARISVIDRDLATASATVDEIRRNGGAAIAIQADVSEAPDNERMVRATIEAFGTLDVLFANAGIVSAKLLHEMSVEEWDRMIAVNLRSVFLACRFALPELMRRAGVILCTGSTAGTTGAAAQAHYCASKAGVINLVKALALDYAPYKIRVNCLCPGPVSTNIARQALQALSSEARARMDNWILAAVPMKRIADPEELARAALFLCSADASFVTGHNMVVDGGQMSGFSVPLTE